MKKNILFIAVLILFSFCAPAQNSLDSSFNQKIATIENGIARIKNLSTEEQKGYFAILSDVENRKNTLKTLLKTPVEKRDKTWQESWNQNYSMAIRKLEGVQDK